MKVFLAIASLPVDYLNKFEKLMRLYEEGSLPGQIISVRKLTNKNKKSKTSCKLEVPISFLKLHLGVTQLQRNSALDLLFDGSSTFPEYCQQLEKQANISSVQGQVEKLTKEKFTDICQRYPGKFSDAILLDFGGAKVSSCGENIAYKKLVNHVNSVMSSSRPNDSIEEQLVKFAPSDNMNMIQLGNKMKEFDLIIIHSSEDKEFTASNEFALTEVVKENPNIIGVIVNLDEKFLKEKMNAKFDLDVDVIVDYVSFKRAKPITVNGFRKEFLAVAVFGNKTAFNLKEIKSLYNFDLKKSIPFMIDDLSPASGKVLFAFSDLAQAVDLDPHGSLAKKKITVCYMAEKQILDDFSSSFVSKVT